MQIVYDLAVNLFTGKLVKWLNLKLHIVIWQAVWLSWTLYLYFLPLSGSFLVVSMNKYRKRLKTDGHYWFQSAISSYYICTYILMYTYVVCTTIVRILTRKLWIEEVIHRFACIFRCTYLVCNCNLYSKLYIPSTYYKNSNERCDFAVFGQ